MPLAVEKLIKRNAMFATTQYRGLRVFLPALPEALCIVVVFILAGLTGHEPWKADEAYVFGMVYSMPRSGDWIVPMLGGEPFMEKPPLYYWVAACFSWLLSGWMGEPDSARMASGFFMLVACLALGKSARQWWGDDAGRHAPLLLISCLGTLTQTHMMMPDVALLAGFALSVWGFSRISTGAAYGGIWLGTGVGMAFLSKGVFGPGVIGITALLLPTYFAQWRYRAYLRELGEALLVSLPWLLIWPLALYVRSPILFMEWFWENNLGRFFGFSPMLSGTEQPALFWPTMLPWFTFPALPLALYTLWKKRSIVLMHPATQYGLVASASMVLVLLASSAARVVYALPLLLSLSILAVPGAMLLPRGIERAWLILSALLFGLGSAFLWGAWAIMTVTHAPPDWPWLLRFLPANFIPSFDSATVALAAALTISAFYLWRRLALMPGRGLAGWALGLVLSWALLSTLWMPWLDYAKSYRSVFDAMPVPDVTAGRILLNSSV
jgi:4-amino-4-deoxy-L-arabinose transferase-like glycosyltransferase